MARSASESNVYKRLNDPLFSKFAFYEIYPQCFLSNFTETESFQKF